MQRPGKCRKGRKPVRSHDAIEDHEVARLRVATGNVGGNLHDHLVLLMGLRQPGIDAAMLDISPQIIAMEMHLWHAGQVSQRSGDCRLARAGMAGEKQDMAAKIVRHVPLLTFGRHKADDDVIIVLSMLPIWRILYWPARRQ
jgi:hypothetical protein